MAADRGSMVLALDVRHASLLTDNTESKADLDAALEIGRAGTALVKLQTPRRTSTKRMGVG
jgi:hypothetical protein